MSKALSEFWAKALINGASKAFPGVFDTAPLIESWKVDGYNDGTVTLYGIFRTGPDTYERITLPDYRPATREIVVKQKVITEVWVPKV